jgi:hypothetical protein
MKLAIGQVWSFYDFVENHFSPGLLVDSYCSQNPINMNDRDAVCVWHCLLLDTAKIHYVPTHRFNDIDIELTARYVAVKASDNLILRAVKRLF